jgi:hypothetical protein
MTEYPRLAVDEIEAPAPLPFPRTRTAPGRTDDRTDATAEAERALVRAQRALDDLSSMVDEMPASIPFRGPQDDGPRAA